LQATKVGMLLSDDLGDRFMLQLQYQQKSTDDIAREFGREFADELATVTPGSWQGPIKSGYGVHLVFVEERDAASIYPFDEVRERVKNDYLFELRQTRNDEVLEKLKARYEIVIEGQ
jgi:parvulin-like peptidyl-prolyl isomerase